jgi:DNA polymerase III delta subunit
MNKIITSENITIDESAKKFILSLCNNNVKILINYIEKFKLLGQNIDFELATNICTNISFNTFETYTELLKQGKLYDSIKILYSIFDKGYSVMDVLDNFFLFVKITNIITEEQKYDIVEIICKYITIFHNIHEDEIELALFSNNLYNILYLQPNKLSYNK